MNRIACALLAVASFVPTLFAQDVCWQENGGTTFNNGFFQGPGDGITAVRVVPGFALTIAGVELFTGEAPGTGRVSIWSDDAAAAQPLAQLAERTFATAVAKGFQGANFLTPVSIAAGQPFWVAWSLPFTAQSPIDETKPVPGQFYRTSLDAGASWFGPFQFNANHFKFRLRGACGPCTGFTIAASPACNGVAGVPRLTGGGCPSASHLLQLRIEDAAPSASAVLFVGTGSGSAPLVPSCSIHVLPIALALPLPLDPSGTATIVALLPPSVPTIDLFAQAFISDPSMFVGFSATNALRIAIR